MDLTNYTIEELKELKNTVSNMIHTYEDGYLYICKVRSYGRNWVESDIKNKHTLQDLLYKYDGEDGIVDVYSTNPDLGEIHNYGELNYIVSEEDYEKWNRYEVLKQVISQIEKQLDDWDNRDNVPFRDRPMFSPIYTREDLSEYKKKLEEYDMSFIFPKPFVSSNIYNT
jgi:hypothetical protein